MSAKPSGVDWQHVVLKLARHFGSQRKAAHHLGMSETAFRSLASQDVTHPLFDTGVRLLKAYSDHVEPVDGIDAMAKLTKLKV